MKRQHQSLGGDDLQDVPDDKLLVAKRNQPSHSTSTSKQHEVLHKASLLNVDSYTMSEVLRYVPEASIVNFCFIGNHRFAALLKSSVMCIRSSKLTYFDVDIVKPYVAINRCITSSCFPNLREIHQVLPFRATTMSSNQFTESLTLNVTLLPASLTKLVLKGAVIRLEYILEANVHHLASLNTLVVDNVRVFYAASDEVDTEEVLKVWLTRIVKVANHLETLTYLRRTQYDPFDCCVLANLIPKSITALSMDASVLHDMTPEQWPPGLENLSIQLALLPNATFDVRETFTVPPTVTCLSLYSHCEHGAAVNSYISRGFNLTHPSQIVHLNIKLGCDPNVLLEAINKLSSLKSLKLRWNYKRSPIVKYSLLPRSLTRLDVYVPVHESEWKSFPLGLTFRPFFSGYPIFQISLQHDASILVHLPKTLVEVQTEGRPMPVLLPNLKSVVLSDVPAASLLRQVCDANLINLPPCLTSLYVSTNSLAEMFWLHNDGDDASGFSQRFPNLMQFELRVNTSLSAAINQKQNMTTWFAHLPRTLSALSVSFRVQPSTIKSPGPPGYPAIHAIDLRDIRLPCLLDSFEFMCPSQTLILPRVVPASLKHLHARAMYMRVSSNAVETLRKSIPDCEFDIGAVRFHDITVISTIADDDVQ
jgi:hypothetical protein